MRLTTLQTILSSSLLLGAATAITPDTSFDDRIVCLELEPNVYFSVNDNGGFGTASSCDKRQQFLVRKHQDNKMFLITGMGTALSAQPNGNLEDRDNALGWEEMQFENRGGGQYALWSPTFSYYVKLDGRETFGIQDLGRSSSDFPEHLINIPVFIKVDQRQIKVDPYNGRVSQTSNRAVWEKARIQRTGNYFNIVFDQYVDEDETLYLSAAPGEHRQLETRHSGEREWERFFFEEFGDGCIGIRSYHGTYIRAHRTDEAKLDTARQPAAWECAEIIPVPSEGCSITPEQEDLLRALNHARALHGQDPFTWRDQVACDMQASCNDPNAFDGSGHMKVPDGVDGLWALNGAGWTGDNVVSAWYGERPRFSNGVCWHGTNPTCGHFLAIVRDIMTDVACAVCTTGPNPGTYCNMEFTPVPFNDGSGYWGVGRRVDYGQAVSAGMPSLTTAQVQAQLNQCQASACP